MPNRILLIDDDEILQDLLVMHLEVEGFEVQTAPDGRSGLEALRKQQADLVVLDLMMPVMDGFSFMRALKTEVPTPPPVIVLSAAGHGERQQSMKAAGAHSVVRKPVNPAEFLACIRAALGPGS